MKTFMKTLRIITRVTSGTHFLISALNWVLAFLILLFNLLGFWTAWHLVGFSWLFYNVLVYLSFIYAIIFSFFSDTWKRRIFHIILNSSFLLINILVAVFTVFVSSTWFW